MWGTLVEANRSELVGQLTWTDVLCGILFEFDSKKYIYIHDNLLALHLTSVAVALLGFTGSPLKALYHFFFHFPKGWQ